MKISAIGVCLLGALLVALVVVSEAEKTSKDDDEKALTKALEKADAEDLGGDTEVEIEVTKSTKKPAIKAVKVSKSTKKPHKKPTTSKPEEEESNDSEESESDDASSGSRYNHKMPRFGR